MAGSSTKACIHCKQELHLDHFIIVEASQKWERPYSAVLVRIMKRSHFPNTVPKYVAPHFQYWQSLLDPMIAIIGSLEVL